MAQKERKEALDETEILTTKLYYEKDRRRVAEKVHRAEREGEREGER